jgi:hypothetical protein
VQGTPTIAAVLTALELQYPMLQGAIRDHGTCNGDPSSASLLASRTCRTSRRTALCRKPWWTGESLSSSLAHSGRILARQSDKAPIDRGNGRVPARGHRHLQFAMQHVDTLAHALAPSTASAYKYGRPISTAEAPSASAFSTSVPRRTPPSNSTGMRPWHTSTTSGKASMAGITVSIPLAPWFETTIPCTPAFSA